MIGKEVAQVQLFACQPLENTILAELTGGIQFYDTPYFSATSSGATSVSIDTKFSTNLKLLPPPHPEVNDVEWITRKQVHWKWEVAGFRPLGSAIVWIITNQQVAEVSQTDYAPSAMSWPSVFLIN